MRESELLEPLQKWLWRTRRIRDDTVVISELPWLGRRVDLATLTSSGIMTAYELKIRNNIGAIEQAAKNAHAFGRSYVVTATYPSLRTRILAESLSVGVLALVDGHIEILIRAPLFRHPSVVSRILKQAIYKKAGTTYV